MKKTDLKQEKIFSELSSSGATDKKAMLSFAVDGLRLGTDLWNWDKLFSIFS